MDTKNITLKVNSKVYGNYREFCKQKGWIVSRQFEILMETQMKKEDQIMESRSEIRTKVKKYLKIKNNKKEIQTFFKKLNYPKELILGHSYIKKLRNFSLTKDG